MPATPRNSAPAIDSATSSRELASRERVSQESSSSRSLALDAWTSSTGLCIGLAAVGVDVTLVDPPLVLHARVGVAVRLEPVVEDQPDLGGLSALQRQRLPERKRRA